MSVYEPDPPFSNENSERAIVPMRRASTPDIISLQWQRRTSLIVLTVLLGLGLGTFALMLAGESGSIAWLAVAVIAALALATLVKFFPAGIIAFLMVCWIAIGTPSVAEGGSGGGSKSLLVSQAGLLLLIGVWVARSFFQQRFTLFKTPVNLPIFLYLLVCLLSTTAGILFPNEAVRAFSPKQFLQVNILENVMRWLALGGLLLIGNNLTGRMVAVGAAAVVLPGVLTYTSILSFIPASFFLAFPQVLAMAVLTAFTVGDVKGLNPWLRILGGVIALSIFGTYFIKGTEWVSGWVSALIALVIIFWVKRRELLAVGIAVAFIAIALNFGYFYEKVYKANFYGDGPTSDRARQGQMGTFENDRVRMLRGAFRYAETFPLGVGLGNYRSYNKYFGRVEVWNTTDFTSAHGTYSQALSETGWPGLITLLMILVGSGRMMWRYYKHLPTGSWEKMYLLGGFAGCMGNFCAAFIGDYLFPSYHNGGLGSFGTTVYTWFMVGISIAIGKKHGLDWDRLSQKVISERRQIAPVYRHGPYAEPNTARGTTE